MNEQADIPVLPERRTEGHKGTFGTVAVIGGCCHAPQPEGDGVVMIGGAAFSAIAALRSGCGLAKLVMGENTINEALTIAPSATGVALMVDIAGDIIGHEAAGVIDGASAQSDCVVVGPGLGTSAGAQAVTLRAVMQEETAVVVDADALNCLALTEQFQLDLRAPVVMTPHVGEARRIGERLGIEVGEDLAVAAEQIAQKLGCVVVLKSAATAASDGHRVWVHDKANPVLGTAGTGDVLSGLIGGLIAQFAREGLGLFECAQLGVIAHSGAAAAWGDRTGASGGMLAAELAGEIPGAMEKMRGGRGV